MVSFNLVNFLFVGAFIGIVVYLIYSLVKKTKEPNENIITSRQYV